MAESTGPSWEDHPMVGGGWEAFLHPTHRPPTLVLSSTTRSPSADTHRTDFTDFRPIWGGGREQRGLIRIGSFRLLLPTPWMQPLTHSPPSASSRHLHKRAFPGTPPLPHGPGTWVEEGRKRETQSNQSLSAAASPMRGDPVLSQLFSLHLQSIR